MVKGIILDVDGVIVGSREGINFPVPGDDVIDALGKLHEKGMPIILCTGKFGYSIIDIIERARLDNPHITDGGALIINPLRGEIIREHVIDKEEVLEIVSVCLRNNIYIEVYTPEVYFIDKSQSSEFTEKRTDLLQKEPAILESLEKVAQEKDIIKILCFATEDHQVEVISEIGRSFGQKINFIWSSHPYLPNIKCGLITAPNVSKANAVKETLEGLDLEFEDMLGIGDTAADWNFMQYCKYAATLENGDEKIKELVKEKGEGNFLIAPHINDNGIFEILKYFL